MNSMLDAQSEIATLATVSIEEVDPRDHSTSFEDVVGANDADDGGPDCDDVAEPVYDGPADDTEMYPQDIEQDEFPW